jgi:hypothetical protein
MEHEGFPSIRLLSNSTRRKKPERPKFNQAGILLSPAWLRYTNRRIRRILTAIHPGPTHRPEHTTYVPKPKGQEKMTTEFDPSQTTRMLSSFEGVDEILAWLAGHGVEGKKTRPGKCGPPASKP